MADDNAQDYLFKAEESLAGAESELVAGRYNNCANRCYYACFQAAIAALQRSEIRPGGGGWGHDFVDAQFEGQLIFRRKVYPSGLRGTIRVNRGLRLTADYDPSSVSRVQANRASRRTREFITTITTRERAST
jgi:uncharacterized protein (UPF0332 family)